MASLAKYPRSQAATGSMELHPAERVVTRTAMKYFFISLSSEKADVFDHPRSIRCLGSQKSYEPISLL
jgi:hypothetical protein